MAEKKEKKGFFAGTKKYFKDVKGEMKKVVWPSKSQLLKSTAVVIVVCAVVGAFIALLDLGLGMSLGKAVNKVDEAKTKAPVVQTEDVNANKEEAPSKDAPKSEEKAPEEAPAEKGEKAETEDAQ